MEDDIKIIGNLCLYGGLKQYYIYTVALESPAIEVNILKMIISWYLFLPFKRK